MERMNWKDIDEVLFHHSASRYGSVPQITEWHLDRGFSDIGYTHVIQPDGTTEAGRSVEFKGAHAYGRNSHSFGVCLVGDFNKTDPDIEQYMAAARLYKAYCLVTGRRLKIGFHRQGRNDCPGKNLNREFLIWLCQNEV